MGVYIKGMKMPSSCRTCHMKMNCDACEGFECVCVPLHKGIGYFDDLIADKRRDDCPLIELTPHGRLIDADALMETYRERKRPTLSDGEDGSKERVRYLDFISTLQAIKDAPTIIETEEES